MFNRWGLRTLARRMEDGAGADGGLGSGGRRQPAARAAAGAAAAPAAAQADRGRRVAIRCRAPARRMPTRAREAPEAPMKTCRRSFSRTPLVPQEDPPQPPSPRRRAAAGDAGRRPGTRPSSPKRSSSAGSSGSRRAELTAFDTETDVARADACRAGRPVAAVEPYHGLLHPGRPRYAGAPDQLVARARAGEAASPGSRASVTARSARTSSTTCTCWPTTASRFAGLEHDTLLESYVLEAHRTHSMDALAARHLERRTITFQDVAGKGARHDRLRPGRGRARQRLCLPRTPRWRCTCISTLFPRIDAEPKLLHIYRDIEMPTDARAAGHGAPRRADRRRPAEPRSRTRSAPRLMALERQAYEAPASRSISARPSSCARSCSRS